MMATTMARMVTAAGFLIAASGCAGNGLGNVGDILGGVLGQGAGGGGTAQQGQVTAEVQAVNTQSQAIQVRTSDGQTGTLEFDGNTVVVYQQQQYPITALERGDVATFQIQQIAQNRYYTARIDVTQSVQDRTGQSSNASGDLQQIYGQVGQIDRQNGFFELRTNQGNFTVVVSTSSNTPISNRFNSLRTGENVTIEGVYSGTTRIDLYRFL